MAMCSRFRHAFSLVEVLVAMVVIALALGPLVHVLSSSNRVSNASIYEVMAVHYASELGEQLQRLSSRLKPMTTATGKTVKQLFEDPTVLSALEPQASPVSAPGTVKVPGTSVALFYSALHPNFTARRLMVRPLHSSGRVLLNVGKYWDVTIGLAWKLTPNDAVVHGASFSIILREG